MPRKGSAFLVEVWNGTSWLPLLSDRSTKIGFSRPLVDVFSKEDSYVLPVDVPTIDPDVLLWTARVTAQGGTYAQADLDSQSALVKAYKTAGCTDSNCRLNLFAGSDLIAARCPVLRGGGPDIDSTTGSGVTYSRSLGMRPVTNSSSSDGLNTGITVFTLGGSAGDASFGCYMRSHYGASSAIPTPSSTPIMGCQDTISGKILRFWARSGSGGLTMLTDGIPYANSGALGGSGSVPARLVAGTSDAATSRVFHDGAQVGSSSGAAISAPATTTMTVFRAQTFIGPSPWAGVYMGGYHISRWLSGTSIATLATAWQTYCTAMGRQI